MHSQSAKLTDMTTGAILPHILRFALPLFIGNLFQQFYNTTDSFVVGRFLGRDSLAALGSTTQLVFTVIGFFNGFSTGAQVVISQCFGSKNIASLRKAVHTAIVSSFFISALMTALGLFFSPLMLRLISVPEEVFEQATSYISIYFAGIVFLIFYNMGSGILRALGDSKRPLYFLIFSCLVNIILDIVFVVFLKLGIKGAAWATVISEAISTIPVLCTLIFTKDIYKLSLKEFKIDFHLLSKMLKIGLPGAISSSITAFSNTFMQKYVNAFGSSCIAGWSVFARLDQLVTLPMRSISFSATTFTAQNYGAGQKERIKKGIRDSFILSMLLISFISILLFVFAREISSIFITEAESIKYGSLFIRYTAPFYVLCATSMLFSQILRGLGKSMASMLITFSTFVLLRQSILFIGSRLTSSFALVAIAYPIVWIAASAAMVLYFRKVIKK